MSSPNYAFVLKLTDGGKRLAERWYMDLEESISELQVRYNKNRALTEGELKYTLFDRLMTAKRKSDVVLDLAIAQVSIFDSYQYEISSIYREHFRDGYVEYSDDPDVSDIKLILDEFYRDHPNMAVLNLIPTDFEGHIGFVVMPKDMNL